MANWHANGGITGYNPTTGGISPDMYPLIYSTPTVQDAGAITRGQYMPRFSGSAYLTVRVNMRFRVWPEDFIRAATANVLGAGRIYAVLYVVPSTAFGGRKPTNNEIRTAAHNRLGWAYRSTEYVQIADTGGTIFNVQVAGPQWTEMQPNTKHWVLAALEVFGVLNDSTRSGVPIPNQQDSPNHNNSITNLGRATSFWTNRTPQAPVLQITNNGVPTQGGEFPAGTSTLELTLGKGNDPDSVTTPDTPAGRDWAGVQVQYAPLPQAGDPPPVWQDLPFGAFGGAGVDGGSWIAGSSYATSYGAAFLRIAGAIPIAAGGSATPAAHALLPSGYWQLRARTFDYGHAYPLSAPPVGKTIGQAQSLTPNNYPAVNRSPWSDPAFISVLDQVLPPVPLSPVRGVAVPKDPASTFFRFSWQYRNTALPPFAQASWQLRWREGDSPAWNTSSGSGAGSFAFIPTADFKIGSRVVWQVKTHDSAGGESDWSVLADFWVVAPTASGPQAPTPNDVLEGASLGIGTHRAFIYRRGGEHRVGEITNLSHVSWGRVRDDVSNAKIVTNRWDLDSGNLLAKLQTWAYELVLYRDNGFESTRVWEGPITLLTYEQDSVTIQARDVMAYASRRIIKQDMHDNRDGATAVARAVQVLQNAFAADDPNVLPYLTPMAGDNPDVMQYRSLREYSRTAFEEVDDMAANAGLDYTAVGRSIIVWSTKNRIGLLPEFRDSDLGSAPIVSEYGMSLANYLVVTDGNGIWGAASRLQDSNTHGNHGYDPVYGRVEVLTSSWASSSEESDTGEYTEEQLAKLRQSFQDAAERSIASRYPAPVIVRVPDNTTLNPNAVVSIKNLVPGVAIPLRSVGTLRHVVGTQKLDSVKVVEEAGKETVSITLSPFDRQDDAMGEGGETE